MAFSETMKNYIKEKEVKIKKEVGRYENCGNETIEILYFAVSN